LVARLAAGTLPAERPAAPRPLRTRPARVAPADALRLPRGYYWLIRLLPYEAAGYGSQLQALLAEPEMAALLAAAPQAGRILRPLCRLLAITPEGLLALPSAAGKPAPQPRAAKPAPAAPPSAISLICATLSGPTPAVELDPPPRKPPWLTRT